MRILIVEDNKDLSFLIKENLSNSYVVDLAADLDEAYYLMDLETYDLVVLDLSLPDGDGANFCKEIRDNTFKAPILVLTGTQDIETKVKCFNNGADDYLTKPFSILELEARIKALLRRKSDYVYKDDFILGDFKINFLNKKVELKGEEVKLTRKEFFLLELFVRNRGKILKKEQMVASVWEDDSIIFGNTVESHIAVLRRKIGRNIIETVRGIGYRFGGI